MWLTSSAHLSILGKSSPNIFWQALKVARRLSFGWAEIDSKVLSFVWNLTFHSWSFWLFMLLATLTFPFFSVVSYFSNRSLGVNFVISSE